MPAFQNPPHLSLGLAQQAAVCPCALGGGLRDDRETLILPGAWEPLQLLGGLPGHRAGSEKPVTGKTPGFSVDRAGRSRALGNKGALANKEE